MTHEHPHRKTVTVDDDLYHALQALRAKSIQQGKETSFSAVVNQVLRKALATKPQQWKDEMKNVAVRV